MNHANRNTARCSDRTSASLLGIALLAAVALAIGVPAPAGASEEEKAGHGEADEDKNHFLFRLGVAYDIHIGSRYGIAPAVNLDLVDGEKVWVYGLNFAVKF